MPFREDLDAIILSCLAAGPAHGYEISKRIRARSQEVLIVAEGKLYPALHSLEDSGEITATWVPQATRPPRKVYELTEAGWGTLERKQSEWSTFAKGVAAVMRKVEA
jgi:DNA-binding PadR family transcriptional regulator